MRVIVIPLFPNEFEVKLHPNTKKKIKKIASTVAAVGFTSACFGYLYYEQTHNQDPKE